MSILDLTKKLDKSYFQLKKNMTTFIEYFNEYARKY